VTELQTISPIDGRVVATRNLATPTEIEATLNRARKALDGWRKTPVDERIEVVRGFVDAFVSMTDQLVEELAWQIGRPVRYGAGEIRGFEERARHMIAIAEDSLADLRLPEKPGYIRYIKREPLGVVFTVAAWNYPYLIAVNSIVPALLAGNVVVLKHSAQTPLCAERLVEAATSAGLPEGVFQSLHLSHGDAAEMVGDSRVDFVAFTGSVAGGRAIRRAASERFVGVGLELGGKDPAYVRPDANLQHAVESLVDGAFFNSGQSCCGIERIYVHRDRYDAFVEGVVQETSRYVLGDPMDPETTLGPVVRKTAARGIRQQVKQALEMGARSLVDPDLFPARGGTYIAPRVLVDVDHRMDVMSEETFGPVVGIMSVDNDEHAIELMNDSCYGLTASIWTNDVDAAVSIGDQIHTGTWFMNRCDYLDPALAWVGVKDSGVGCTLSQVGYEHLTRPKSYHLRMDIGDEV